MTLYKNGNNPLEYHRAEMLFLANAGNHIEKLCGRSKSGSNEEEGRMRRRKKKEEHRTSHERWLIRYADFITLLFPFFVVLYASSQVDKRKVGRLAMAIQVAFQELGVFYTSNTHIPLSDMEAIPFS